jgi:hypothetical protein
MASKRRTLRFSNAPNTVYGTNANSPNANANSYANLRNSRKSITIKSRKSNTTQPYNPNNAREMAKIESEHNSPGAILNAISKMKKSPLKTKLTNHARQLYKKSWAETIFGSRTGTRKNNAAKNKAAKNKAAKNKHREEVIRGLLGARNQHYDATEVERLERAEQREEAAARQGYEGAQKAVLERRAYKFLTDHGINPENSNKTLIQQAQNLSKALRK